jgi:hypothetical protein
MANQKPTAVKAKLQFHYLKSPDYREVTCHGIVGGITPNGKQVCLSVFSERAPIPRMVQYDVEPLDGKVQFDEATAQPTLTEARQGVIRHVEYTMYFDLDMARNFRKWLDDRIKTLEGA